MNVGFLERVDKTNEMMGRATGPDLSLNPNMGQRGSRDIVVWRTSCVVGLFSEKNFVLEDMT